MQTEAAHEHGIDVDARFSAPSIDEGRSRCDRSHKRAIEGAGAGG
jgi:hypothetical protein